MLDKCDECQVPLFKTKMVTMKFINAATIALEMEFAPQVSEHGSMVDILGIGVLIRGESGIGKSESVLALLERGYSLVSDDVTRIRLIEGRDLIGTSSETTRYHMEIRGLGIINVPAVFGVAGRQAREEHQSRRHADGVEQDGRTWTASAWNGRRTRFSASSCRTLSFPSGRDATSRG